MKKIKLDLDELRVESFDTTPLDDSEAVEGYCTQHYQSCGGTCDYTCAYTCGYSCGDSCPPRTCIGSSGGTPCP